MSYPNSSLFSKGIGKTLLTVKPILDRAVKSSTQVFNQHQIIKPRVKEKFYSWTHYGIFIPNLPEPHRYLNIMILIGTPSAQAFDHDDIITTSPRKTATFFSSTAAMPKAFLKAYDIDTECTLTEDNQTIQLANDIKITGKFPHFRVEGNYLDLEYDLGLHVSHHVSWFLKNPIYDHFSLLTQFSGTLKYQGKTQKVADLCTYEYARSFGLHSLRPKTLIPFKHKIPLDFFTYQIINLDDQTQILLTKADINQSPAAYTVHIRHLNQPAEVYTQVSFKISKYQDTAQFSPQGHAMPVPDTFTWQARDDHNNLVLSIEATVDSPYHYGHGKGYVSHYAFQGQYRNLPIKGRGYMEYVNLQSVPMSH